MTHDGHADERAITWGPAWARASVAMAWLGPSLVVSGCAGGAGVAVAGSAAVALACFAASFILCQLKCLWCQASLDVHALRIRNPLRSVTIARDQIESFDTTLYGYGMPPTSVIAVTSGSAGTDQTATIAISFALPKRWRRDFVEFLKPIGLDAATADEYVDGGFGR